PKAMYGLALPTKSRGRGSDVRNTLRCQVRRISWGPWGSAGSGVVRVASLSLLLAGHHLSRSCALGPNDRPAFFTELDQRDHAVFDAVCIFVQRRLLACIAGHRLQSVLARHERDIGHALLEGLEPWFHR